MITFKRHGSSYLATVKPLDIGRRLRIWIVPAVVTAAFSLLLLHRSSDSHVVFNRYSVDYAILLVLAALNLGLLWRQSLLCISYAVLVSYGIAVVSCTFLFDFFVMGVKLPFVVSGETDWIRALLLASFLLQLNGVQRLTKNSRTTAIFFAFRRVFTGKARDYELIDVGQSLQVPTALASGQIAAEPLSLPLNDVAQEQCLNSIGRPVGPGGKALCKRDSGSLLRCVGRHPGGIGPSFLSAGNADTEKPARISAVDVHPMAPTDSRHETERNVQNIGIG